MNCIVHRVIRKYPDGVGASKFCAHPLIAKPKMKEARERLGYKTVRELLLTMPDIVTLRTAPPGHPLNSVTWTTGYAVFPAGYEFAVRKAAPAPGLPIVTKLVNIKEEAAEEAPAATGFEIMNSLRSQVPTDPADPLLPPAPEPPQLMGEGAPGGFGTGKLQTGGFSNTELVVGTTSPNELAPIVAGSGLPPGVSPVADPNDLYPTKTTAILADRLKKLLKEPAVPDDVEPYVKKIRPTPAHTPLPRRPYSPLLAEFRDTMQRVLLSHPEGTTFQRFGAQVCAGGGSRAGVGCGPSPVEWNNIFHGIIFWARS